MATYWLDPTSGNDANDGTTKALAVATFSDVAGLVSSGDTIKIVDGTHDISSQAGTVTIDEAEITLVSENGNPSTCKLDYDDSLLTLDFTDGSTGVTIEGIQFYNSTNTNTNYKGIINLTGGSTSTFLNNWFIENELVFVSGSFYLGVIYLTNTTTTYDITMTGCIISAPYVNVAGYTRGFFGGNDINTVTFTMSNCVMYLDTGAGDFHLWGVRLASNWTITIKNSIFQSQVAWKIYDENGSGFSTGNTFNISYCCTYEEGAGTINLMDFVEGDGMITTDPLFVDTGASNFELQASSPCIDTGTIV